MTLPAGAFNFQVWTSQDIEDLTVAVLEEAENAPMPQPQFRQLVERIAAFKSQWNATFECFGYRHQGELAYQDLVVFFEEDIVPLITPWLSLSGESKRMLEKLHLSSSTLPSQPFNQRLRTAKKMLNARSMWHQTTSGLTQDDADVFQLPEFEHPIFIVSAPRAGSTLLFETLCQFTDLWTIGEESHEIIEGIPELHPGNRGFRSNRLTAADASSTIVSTLQQQFTQQIQNRNGQKYVDLPPPERPQQVRFLEKTPKNALRIPFLKTVFPGARFIYLYRNPQENISSLMEGWRSRCFTTYKRLPGWSYREWSFLLPPGWSSLQKSSLVEIAAYQWKTANSYILHDLKVLPSDSWHLIHYTDLIQSPKQSLKQIAQFANLAWDEQIEQFLSQSLPISRLSLSPPAADKWRKNERDIVTVLQGLEPVINLLRENDLCLKLSQPQDILEQ